MEITFADDDLDRLETDARFTMRLGAAVVKAYRRRIQFIRAAVDQRDPRAMKSAHFERLRGARSHQYSMRLNDQWRLIVEFESTGGQIVVRVVGVEDYH